jgi:16S rRNA processing protein RimM
MRIAIGIIRKPHGVRGEASVEPWTDSVDRFDEVGEVTLVSPDESESRQVRIESVRSHAGRALVKLEGLDTPEAVDLVRGWTLEIPAEDARKLDPDEYFLHDLVGLTLVDAAGRERGVVTALEEGGGGILLNVKRPDGRRFDLPFAADLCTEIDLANRRIIVSIPAGLDDLDSVEA